MGALKVAWAAMPKALVFVSGASSGIGAELAKLHAPHGDLLLVARRKDRLEALAADLRSHGNTVHVLAADLEVPAAVQSVIEYCMQHKLDVDVLINNAGYGAHGTVVDIPIEKQLSMIDLNIKGLVALTHAFVPGMVARGQGRILQVGSTAGFVPGPLQATYYATKAFVNSFSRALHEELRNTGVTCTVLCPGPVETEFVEVASMEGTSVFKRGAISAEQTAKAGYKAMMRGKDVVVVPGYFGPVLQKIAPLMPRKLVVKASRKAMEKS